MEVVTILTDVSGGRANWNGVTFFSASRVSEATLKDNKVYVECKERHINKTKTIETLQNIPLLRGIAIMGESVFIKKKLVFLFLLIVFLNISSWVFSPQGNVSISYQLLLAGMAIILVIGLFIIRFSKLSRFHGAEHMAFNAYKQGLELTIENVRQMNRVSDNCGTNLFTIIITILCFMVIFAPIPPIISILVSVAIAYELFLLKSTNPIARPFYAIGRITQKYIVTAKPNDKQIETAILALQKLKTQ
ncbi:DUF1385 domain-containing protein [Brevibacillus sp. NPDC058079]|uniref:DUF1385 domain-containing protein n=1 Tax=Brevibacillus sp. NPDC058079 TaxID=3346330 RepID=UPI0036E2E011